jgi:branched-chain amino acid transport system permease protein
MVTAWGVPLVPGILITMIIVAIIAIIFGALFVQPFIAQPQGSLVVMVTTLAASTIVVNVVQLVWGPRIKQLPTLWTSTASSNPLGVGANQVAFIVAAPVLIGGLLAVLRFTKVGLAIRAVEQNRDHARLVGIRPGRVYALTIVIASVLAAFAGILLGGIGFITPSMGDDPLLRAFIVVIFGGLSTVGGAVVGAYVIGFVEATSTYFFGLSWTPVILFTLMILVMLVRPQGLVTRRTAL